MPIEMEMTGLQSVRDVQLNSEHANAQEGKVGKIVGLFICAAAGQPMVASMQAQALAGGGFVGDRYATNQGTFSRSPIRRHVSLIACEAIEEANRNLVEHGLAPFGMHETRRNIITEGFDVYAVLGRQFQIGEVRMRGTEPTKPCHRPSLLVQKTGFAQAYTARGGVRAEVLMDGVISVGDLIALGPT